MNRLMLLTFMGIVFATACAAPHKTSGRKPAQSEVGTLDSAKIVEFARYLIKFNRETAAKKYKVVRFPIRAGSDLHPDSAEQELAKVFQTEEFKNSFDLFLPLATAQIMSYNEHLEQKTKLRQIFMDGLKPAERDQLLSMCFSAPAHVGGELTFGPMIANMNFCNYVGLLHSEEEVREALRSFPARPTGVRYDGQLGYHVYTDSGLERRVQILTAAINSHLHRFYELFLNEDDDLKEKWRANKEGAAEADKIEPFDLITTYTTRFIIAKNNGADDESETDLNKIQISKLAQKAIARMLHIKNENAQHLQILPNLTVNKGENALAIMCANGLPSSTRSQDPMGFSWNATHTGTELIETWRPQYNLSDLLDKGKMTSEISCNGVNYKFQTEKLPAEAIPPSAPIQFRPGQELHALMTVSLVSEIDRSAVDQAKKLVGLLSGWEAVSEVIPVKTRDFLRTELLKADAYFPFMHAMDVNYFNIGTENGLALRLRKVVKDSYGADRVLNLAVLLPDGSQAFSVVMMKPTDLAKLLHERYLTKPTPLFLMNNSCSSEKTLFAWTLVFREAIELRKATGKFKSLSSVSDFPHIIGSKRSFGTSSLGEIFSHAEYPLRSLEMLGEGKSVTEIIQYLKAPATKRFLESLGGLFNGNKGYDKSNESKGFEPVYALDHPELLSLGGFRVHVTSPNITGRDQY